MDRESWHAVVHGVAKSWTRLSDWTELERWKSLISGCLMSGPQIKKNRFEVSSFSMQQQWTIPWSDCDMRWKVDCIQQPAMTSSVAGPRKNSKALPKAKIAPKKSWSLFGGLLLVWSTTAFWIPVKPLTLRSMLSKSVTCIKNCSAHIWHWSTEGPNSFPQQELSHNQAFKSWTTWVMKFCLNWHIHLTSHQPTTTSSSISVTFCRKNLSTTSRRKKMVSKRVLRIPKYGFLHDKNK